jgi:two-component system, NtrC family, response regulator AtoC
VNKALSVLVADDEESFRRVLVRELISMGFEVQGVADGEAALSAMGDNEYDVALLDVRMPGMDGITALGVIKQAHPLTEIIMLTGYGTISSAIESVKRGAYHYLTKPCKLEELEALIKKAGERKALERQNIVLRQELSRRDRFDEFVGQSPKLKEVLRLITKVAGTDSTILIQGESGVGKELAARALHRHSARHNNPFIVVDCTSLQEDLLQSELCGHEKGAFTGAITLKHGLFEVADTGTIFLDEIGEMSLALQSKLLRVLETGTFRRLGGVKDIRVDLRIVAATNRDLKEMVGEGRFRQDLYYRLNVVTLVIPPLRERPEDVRTLARHFIDQSILPGRGKKGISDDALALLTRYHWPGNVRELKNVLERALILADGDQIETVDFPSNLQTQAAVSFDAWFTNHPTLEEVERLYIARLLLECGGNRSNVARILDVSERNLYRKIRRYGLN